MNAPTVKYKVLYNNKNITEDISHHLIALSYTDKVTGESDELELQVEDSELLWQNAWFPEKGALISAEIITSSGTLETGNFTIDEIELSGSREGDVVNIRCVAASITKKLRTKRSTAHENKTLREIAITIADKNGLTLQGNIEEIVLERATQNHISDLSFLQKFANEFGYVFSVRGDKMTFEKQKQLENRKESLSLDKTEVLSYSIKDRTAAVYKSATVKHHNPDSDFPYLVESTEVDSEVLGVEDSLEIRERTENKQQAEVKANSALHRHNTQQRQGSFVAPGNVLLISGNNVELTGLGKLSGKYHITQSRHILNRGEGYTTAADINRVATIPASKYIPKKIKNLLPEGVERHGGLLFIPDDSGIERHGGLFFIPDQQP